jgi:DNA repair and recombination RAD54-like protein
MSDLLHHCFTSQEWHQFISLSLIGFVYRFISTGTIEEKIFQRQANKQALSSAVVDEKEDTERHFSIDALRQLFLFNEDTICDTHDTFKCKRCKDGRQVIKAPALLYGDASTYVIMELMILILANL